VFLKVLLILLLFVSPAFATDYYVRPPIGEYNDEDGSDYDNAYDGFADISWATVDSGNRMVPTMTMPTMALPI
jgi:hypothetical protein